MVLITGAVALFSSFSHWSAYVGAALLALVGLLLALSIFTRDDRADDASPISTFVRPLLAVIVLVTLIPRLQPYLSPWVYIGVVVAGLLLIVLRRELRRSLVQALVMAFCGYTALTFFQNRQQLRAAELTKGETLRLAADRVLSLRYIQTALLLTDQVRAAPALRYVSAVDAHNEEVKEKAESLVRGIRHTSQQDMVFAIFKWVTEQVEYQMDPDGSWGKGDYIKSPQATLKSLAGDCDDSSILLASLLESLRIKTYLIFVPEHVFVLVEPEPGAATQRLGKPLGRIEGRPVFALESTLDRPDFRPPARFSELKDRDILVIRCSTQRLARLDRL